MCTRVLLFCLLAVAPAAGQSGPDFVRDIRPILERSCYPCHGPTLQSANLRLDSRQSALARSIVPGNGAASLLYQRVAGIGPSPRMPLSGQKLTAGEVENIRLWIDRGAPWPAAEASAPRPQPAGHWAYVKPVRPEPPLRDSAWVRNPIDGFILEKLRTSGLEPSPEASRETLIRRATLDLTGLPPSVEEVAEFVADKRPEAYERLVDRLLASPHYGERWAGPWLDVARYADTNGYEKDNRRTIWPYRDWVIEALNRDLPFDRFTIEQLAGDLLPNAAAEQKVATGFHRNSQINEEGGIDPEEYRVAAVLDRTDTTAAVWLGSTLGCAQCHDHKFDPFTQEEYYRLFAFFNSTEAEIEPFAGSERRSRGPNLKLPAPRALAAHRTDVEDRMARLEARLERDTPELAAARSGWEEESRAGLPTWTPLQPLRVTSAAGNRLERLPDASVRAARPLPARDAYRVEAETQARGTAALRLEVPADPADSGRSFTLTGFSVEILPLDGEGEPLRIVLSDASSQGGSNVRAAIDDDPATGWRYRQAGTPVDTQAVFVAKEAFGFAGGTRIVIRLQQESPADHEVIGKFRISLTAAPGAGASARIPAAIQSVLATPRQARTTEQQNQLKEYYRSIDPGLASLRESLKALREQWEDLARPQTFVMQELDQPRKTYVHLGGSFLSRGNEVAPGVPAVLHPFPADAPPNRLGLARWIVHPDNPLTARVTVNRMWMQYFGRGIVETPEDFGTQGSRPSHPELLDWLAAEFVRLKWSMKAMHRLIVTSAAYRQSSRVTPQALEKDPANRLLSRAPRLRLEAELIRDNALAIGGLLSRRIGGPSVFPPQPEGIWNLVYNDDKWVESSGADRYRRGIYTFWRRTAPYPMFLSFDAPSREITCTRRITTNTPLQALTILNDPVFFEAARGLARRIMQSASPDLPARAAYGFRACVARAPDPGELARLQALFERELGHFRSHPEAARSIAEPPEGADPAEFAAWTLVSNVLLNLDETVTKP